MEKFEKISSSLQKNLGVSICPKTLSEIYYSGVFSGKSANQALQGLKGGNPEMRMRDFLFLVENLRPLAEKERVPPKVGIFVTKRVNLTPKGYKKSPDKGEIFTDDRQGLFLASRAKAFAKPKTQTAKVSVTTPKLGVVWDAKKDDFSTALVEKSVKYRKILDLK